MEAIKRAIISALQKGDAQDRGFRERVYRQALEALDRSLQARPDLPAEQAHQRREVVKTVILGIEREYLSASRDEKPSAPQPAAEPRAPEVRMSERKPGVSAPEPPLRVERNDRLGFGEEKQTNYLPNGELRAQPEERVAPAPAERRRRPLRLVALILALVVLAALGLSVWFMIRPVNAPRALQELADSAPAPEEQSASNGTLFRQGGAEESWITVFSPANPLTVSTSPDANAEITTQNDETFLLVAAESAEATVSFDVGQGILERLAGKRAIFSLTARTEEGQETQISVTCDFGALGDCGRTRYIVGGALPSEYLFEVDFPDGRPNAGGRITIVPDLEGEGRILEVFSLNVLPVEQ